MKDIQAKGNDTGLQVFINTVPDLSQIPHNNTNPLVITLEMQISDHFEMKCKSNNSENE